MGVLSDMRSLSKYIREHYKRVYLRKDFYVKLRELASKEGLTKRTTSLVPLGRG
jgi:hypothetical protein